MQITQNLKYLLIPFGILASIWMSNQFYNSTHALGVVHFSTTNENIIVTGEELLKNYQITSEGFTANVKLRQNESLIRQVQSEFGLKEGNELLRHKYPGYYWDLRWIPQKSLFGKQDNENKQSNDAENHWENQKELRLQYNTRGKLISFSREIPDSVFLPPVPRSEARTMVLKLISAYSPFAVGNIKSSENDTISGISRIFLQEEERTNTEKRPQRTDYEFQWQLEDTILSNDIKLYASVRGNVISKFEVEYNIPEQYESQTNEIIYVILLTVFFISATILTIVLAFKKSRSYEINFRIGIYLGIIIAVLVAIEYFLMLSRESGWEVIFPLIVVPLFNAGIFIIAWSVSESIGREAWKDKFVPLDLIINGHFIHSYIGKSILKGLAAGSLIFLVSRLVVWLGNLFIDFTVLAKNDSVFEYFVSFNPALMLLSHNFWSVLYILALNCILLITYIYTRTSNRTVTYALTIIPLVLFMHSGTEPIYYGLIVDGIALLLVIAVFFRSDILTTYLTIFTFSIIEVALSFLQADHEIFSGSLLLLILVSVGFTVFAYLALFTRDTVKDFSEIEPAISRFISERQRMQQQLEVARQVQMSFLPHEMPAISGLDVAAKCLPAFEVGGDYFDFIQIDKNRLGVAIGDVSGKGTKAAFYMTLLKGFLQALARSEKSPKEILKELNSLFYENATRDAFISLIYGIFDLQKKELVLARSGHNPVLLHRTVSNSVDTIRSDGLALGLDKGPLFEKKIEEKTVPFMSGDIFVFYTDGLTEARNKQNEEFGEDRLENTLVVQSAGNANAILNGIYKEVQKFKKKSELEDDLTMVVVRIA